MKVFMADDAKAICDRLRDVIRELDQVEVIEEVKDDARAIYAVVWLEPDVATESVH